MTRAQHARTGLSRQAGGRSRIAPPACWLVGRIRACLSVRRASPDKIPEGRPTSVGIDSPSLPSQGGLTSNPVDSSALLIRGESRTCPPQVPPSLSGRGPPHLFMGSFSSRNRRTSSVPPGIVAPNAASESFPPTLASLAPCSHASFGATIPTPSQASSKMFP